MDSSGFGRLYGRGNVSPTDCCTTSGSNRVGYLLVGGVSRGGNRGGIFSRGVVNGGVFGGCSRRGVFGGAMSTLVSCSDGSVYNLGPGGGTDTFTPVDTCGGTIFTNFASGASTSCSVTVGARGRTRIASTIGGSVSSCILVGGLSGYDFTIRSIIGAFRTVDAALFVVRIFYCNFVTLVVLVSFMGVLGAIAANVSLHHERFTVFGSINVAPGNFGGVVYLRDLLCNVGTLIVSVPIDVLLSFLVGILLNSSRVPFAIGIPLCLTIITIIFILINANVLLTISGLGGSSVVRTLGRSVY